MPCNDAETYPEANMEPWLNSTSVFLGNDLQISPEPLRAHKNSRNKCKGLLTNFKKKMQQTELHLIQVDVPVNSLLLKNHKVQ